jgi:spermidine synthase
MFLLSGAMALLYQVAFGKRLGTIFGATAYAVSAVLAAFMAGLALGSYYGGKHAARVRRPLAVYGAAEVIVGLVCAATPHLFDAVGDAYVSLARAFPSSLLALTAARMLLGAVLVVVPTVAMGVTLPMLARALAGATAGEAAARRRLGWLYALNTAGGALGALLGAYFVLPALGVTGAMRAAAVVNVAIGLAAMLLGRAPLVSEPDVAARDAAEEATPASTDEPVPRVEGTLRVALAFASGLLVFAAEVVDTHLLALVIGNSTYAFGLMLATFLACLSAGAALAGPVDRRFGRDALAGALVVAALVMIASVPVWGLLTPVFEWVGAHVETWAGRELVRGAVAFAALAVPTVCMGLTFPLLLRRVAGRRDVGAEVGKLGAVNTLGSIAGSLVAGYALLPALGSEQALRALGLAFAACGVVTLLATPDRAGMRPAPRSRRLLAGLGLGLSIGAALLSPRWDMKVVTSGSNVYFERQDRPERLVLVREDVHGGFTTVAWSGGVHTLFTNGKFQGNDWSEVTAQRSMAHFPALFVRDYGRVLVIGLGTGTTLGTIAAYPFAHIEVAEISPAIVEAARTFFREPNRGALDDARVRLFLEDGRNHLLVAKEPYDLITLEVSSVWFAGAANLYSAEFYRLCRDRLGPRGILQQWVQLHHIRRQELAVTMASVRAAFEHVLVFFSGNQGVVVAAQEPLVASRARLAELERREAVQATLPGAPLAALVDRLLVSGADLDRFIAETDLDGAPRLSTDDNLYLEHATPKGNVMPYWGSLQTTVAMLAAYRSEDAAARLLSE